MATLADQVSNGGGSGHIHRISIGAPTPFENLGEALRSAFRPALHGDSVDKQFDALLDRVDDA